MKSVKEKGGNDVRLKKQYEEKEPISWEDSEVSLHRSYGVRRRLRPWQEKLELGFGRIVVFWILGVLLFVAVGTVVTFFLYFPETWVKVLLLSVGGVILIRRWSRPMRKRMRFERRLRKYCRQRGYQLTREQNFFASLIWSGNREDLILETDTSTYYIRYLTIRKYRSTLYLESDRLLRLVKRPLNSRFTVIFDLQPRAKYYPLDFDLTHREENGTGRRTVKAMILNPVCEEVFYKKADGGYETTGNGGEHFGYRIYTAGGFLDTLLREEQG